MSSLAALLDQIRPGDRVALAGSSGEPTALLDAWRADPDRTRQLSILSLAVAGLNRFDVGHWHESATVTGLFMPPACADARLSGRYRWLPLSYGGVVRHLAEGREPIDIALVQLSPPGPDGSHSLGLSAEFMPQLLDRASRVLGIVNHAMPFVWNAPTVRADRLHALCEVDHPLTPYEPGEVDPASDRIARLIAGLIPDCAALQVGIGKVPAALSSALQDHSRLRIQSGMIGDGFRELAEAGALDPDWLHQGCAMVGGAPLYAWAADRSDFSIAGCEVTHDPHRLAAIDRFVAVNSAIEVDLFGQCNLEYVGGKPVSGPGGAPDFARAAKLSPGGLSIVALPATASRGAASRIRARLTQPGIATLAKTEVDAVVTEHGIADLRGLSLDERADRLIDISAPPFREDLAREWRAISRAG